MIQFSLSREMKLSFNAIGIIYGLAVDSYAHTRTVQRIRVK